MLQEIGGLACHPFLLQHTPSPGLRGPGEGWRAGVTRNVQGHRAASASVGSPAPERTYSGPGAWLYGGPGGNSEPQSSLSGCGAFCVDLLSGLSSWEQVVAPRVRLRVAKEQLPEQQLALGHKAQRYS